MLTNDGRGSFALTSFRSLGRTRGWWPPSSWCRPALVGARYRTIAVVALRYIAGGLSATVDDGEWVLTSYLAANAIILPITGWLSAHLGRRNYFLNSIAIFTLQFRTVWNGRQSWSADPVPHHSGFGRWWSAAQQSGRTP